MSTSHTQHCQRMVPQMEHGFANGTSVHELQLWSVATVWIWTLYGMSSIWFHAYALSRTRLKTRSESISLEVQSSEAIDN